MKPSLLISPGDQSPAEIHREWEALIESSRNLDILRPSLPFFGHLQNTFGREDLSLATVRDNGDTLTGIVPLHVVRTNLTFNIKTLVLGEIGLKAVEIVGSLPLIPDDALLYDRLFASIFESFPDCDAIRMECVPVTSFLWNFLDDSEFIRDRFVSYLPDSIRWSYSIPLPDDFEQYVARHRKKKARDIRRQIRRLRDRGGGRLELRRITARGDVEGLFRSLRMFNSVSSRTASLSRRAEFESLADRGLLLSYLLYCGETPCAAILGNRYRGRYFAELIPRNRQFDPYSVGATILHMAIEDLIRNEEIRVIDLGLCSPFYAHSSTEVAYRAATVLLLRKCFVNRMYKMFHQTFRSPIQLLKMWTRRSRGPTDGPPRVAEYQGGAPSRVPSLPLS